MMIDARTHQNSHKLAYLVYAYPEKKMGEIIKLLLLPSIDINAAIWAATESGYIKDPDKKTGMVEFGEAPEAWDFGSDEEHLENTLVYAFEKLNAEEKDMEENYLANWLSGYFAMDTIIAVKRLIEKQQIAEYPLQDGKETYLFYTLYENRYAAWGRKQFKAGSDAAGDGKDQK